MKQGLNFSKPERGKDVGGKGRDCRADDVKGAGSELLWGSPKKEGSLNITKTTMPGLKMIDK